MKVFRSLLLLLLAFPIVGYSYANAGNASITVEYNDVSLKDIRFPRMPRKYSVESLKTSTGLVNVSFESDFTNVDIFIYKDGEELLNDNYPEIDSDMTLTYDLNTWGKGIYTVDITTGDGISISKQIEFD